MQLKYRLLLSILFCYSFQTYAQLCEGSLGDPVVEINFGSGSTRGAELGTDITAFTYSSSGELDEGEYTIANTTSGLKANAWHVTSDHTGNSNGYMMVINSAVLANEGVFYTKSISGLCSNTTYEFSAWLMNIMNPSAGTDQYHPDVTFRISDTSGNVLGSYNTGDIAQNTSGIWRQYGFFFTLNNDEEVIITILNSAPSAHPGNDIALDDIAFRPCGPTITNSIDNQLGSSSVTLCEDELVSYEFQSEVSSGYSDPQYQWQYSDDFGTSWIDLVGETLTNFTFTETSNSGTYLYRITAANGDNIDSTLCRVTSENYIVNILETPDPLSGDSEQFFCTTQHPIVNDIEVNAASIWYDSITDGNIINSNTALIDGTIYYGAQATSNGCQSDERFAVLITINPPSLIVNDIETTICDTDNDLEEIIDLTTFESNMVECEDCIFNYYFNLSDAENHNEAHRISTPENYNWNSDTDVIYVRIDSADQCYQTAEVIINLEETPIIFIDDYVGLCENDTYITIDAGYGFDTYLWSTGETTRSINVDRADLGHYDVTVTQNHENYSCSATKAFEVILSNDAIISSIQIKDWSDSNNSITVYLSENSVGDYEYSLDDITYQDNNTYISLSPGEYTVYVRDKNGCGTTQELVYLLNYPKYFTPNNDGNHDTWYITNSYLEPNMKIKIFDRYGKLLKLMNYDSHWDGTYNGKNLPTSDYWFLVTREDGRNYSGHFTLKR